MTWGILFISISSPQRFAPPLRSLLSRVSPHAIASVSIPGHLLMSAVRRVMGWSLMMERTPVPPLQGDRAMIHPPNSTGERGTKNHLRYLRITFLQINSPRNQPPPSCLSKTTRFPPKTCVFSYLHIRSISAKLALRTITPMTRTCPALLFVPFCFFFQSGIPSPLHPFNFYYEPFSNQVHWELP